jgi:hypothetical protein
MGQEDIHFKMNFDLKVRNVSKEIFILTGEIKEDKLIKNLIDFIKKNKDEKLSYKTNVKAHFTGFTSLNNNSDFIDFIKLIKNEINIVYNNAFKIVEAWGNICRKGDEVKNHAHNGTTAFCGILYLSDGGPGTFFSDLNLNIEEKIGKFVLFSPILHHSVDVINTDIERITVAFNTDETKIWDT